jgi:NADPH:quinone reductase-like Zn-dependent oxidoreductase
MHAAVITSFDGPPTYREFADPAPRGADEVLVDVLASGLHRRVRSQADGSHYTSTGELPLVPGVDGVARLPDGSVRYFALTDTTFGAMAERTVIDLRRSVELPAGADAVQVAAGMNPAMSAWVALKRRIDFTAARAFSSWARRAPRARWPCRSPNSVGQVRLSPQVATRSGWPR